MIDEILVTKVKTTQNQKKVTIAKKKTLIKQGEKLSETAVYNW
jgi:hypothetical protein